jgi:hypothetical protein
MFALAHPDHRWINITAADQPPKTRLTVGRLLKDTTDSGAFT